MANDYEMEDEDLDVFEEETDNAVALTSGLVITTTVCLVLAFFVCFMALNKYFQVGPLAG